LKKAEKVPMRSRECEKKKNRESFLEGRIRKRDRCEV